MKYEVGQKIRLPSQSELAEKLKVDANSLYIPEGVHGGRFTAFFVNNMHHDLGTQVLVTHVNMEIGHIEYLSSWDGNYYSFDISCLVTIGPKLRRKCIWIDKSLI